MAQSTIPVAPVLSALDFRVIRQRLGWSMAEMGRRMGGDVALITSWESEAAVPDQDALNQYVHLKNHLDQDSVRTARGAVAESVMEAGGLAQITHRVLLNDL